LVELVSAVLVEKSLAFPATAPGLLGFVFESPCNGQFTIEEAVFAFTAPSPNNDEGRYEAETVSLLLADNLEANATSVLEEAELFRHCAAQGSRVWIQFRFGFGSAGCVCVKYARAVPPQFHTLFHTFDTAAWNRANPFDGFRSDWKTDAMDRSPK
jgi:hypothetical protein